MINYFAVDFPQCIILTPSYTGVSKKFIPDENLYLWGYLRSLLSENSVRNFCINKQLREVFLIHSLRLREQQSDMYSINENHYIQRFYTEQIYQSISSIVLGLLNCVCFMKVAKSGNEIPTQLNISSTKQLTNSDVDIRTQFSDFQTFLGLCDSVRISFDKVEDRSTDFHLYTELKPTFIVTANGHCVQSFIEDFISTYNLFFKAVIQALKEHSPAAISSTLGLWNKEL